MSKQIILIILGLVVGAAFVWLTLIWFDWKLLLVIFLALWANNISMRLNR